jgi:monoamine oxidase
MTQRWNKNPWALGAYSYLTLDSSTGDPAILRQTVAGRVLFAGEATIMQYQGSLQGAYITGTFSTVNFNARSQLNLFLVGLAAVKELDALAARPTDP